MRVCQKCHREHITRWGSPACTAHKTKRDETGALVPCSRDRMHGLEVCSMHGGSAKQSRAAATRRNEEAAALDAVRTLGLPIDISPTEALLEEVRWTAGHVQWLRQQVQQLDAEPTHTATDLTTGEDAGFASPSGRSALVWGTTKVKTGGEDRGTTQEAKPSIWYAMYVTERKHLVEVCQAAIRAGVEERKVRLAEQQGDLVAGAIRGILEALYAALLAAGLAADVLGRVWSEQVQVIVPRELRRLGGEA